MNKDDEGSVITLTLEQNKVKCPPIRLAELTGLRKKLILYAMEFRLLVKRVHEKENDPVAQQTNLDVLTCLTEWVSLFSFPLYLICLFRS
jgi:hypothetical protein